MRPVNKGEAPKKDNGENITFKQYSRARRYLIDRIGEYCSYCERKIEANLAIEHVQPKSLNPGLELEWTNFLLACTNCNSTKGDEDISLNDYFWPDLDNTFEFFDYKPDGLVGVANHLTLQDQIKAQKTITLAGLDKESPTPGTVAWQEASDRRLEHRIQALMDSHRFSELYETADNNIREQFLIPNIKTLVIHQGFWSIWMRAFSQFPEVQRELINAFPGTNRLYFQEILNQ